MRLRRVAASSDGEAGAGQERPAGRRVLYAMDNIGGASAAWPTGSTPTTSTAMTPAGSPPTSSDSSSDDGRGDRRGGRAATWSAGSTVGSTVLGEKLGHVGSRWIDPPPVAPPRRSLPGPNPEMTMLRCGLPLWVIPRRDLPIVAATIALGGGAGMHPPRLGRPGRATTAMMDEGTATRSSIELARAAEEMGTSLSSSCGWDGAYVGFQSLTPHWLASLDLAVDVLRNPTFPESEWTRIHGQTLAGLKSERDSAEARAHRGLLRPSTRPTTRTACRSTARSRSWPA